MKRLLWIGMGFVAVFGSSIGARYLVHRGLLSREAGIIAVLDSVAGALLMLLLIVVGQEILGRLGVRPIGADSLETDGSGVRRGYMNYRIPLVAGSVLLSGFFIFAATDIFNGKLDVWILILACFGFYFAYGAIWIYLYSFAYDDTYITALNLNLRAQTHRWTDIVATNDGLEAKLLVFRTTGHARIHNYAKGRDEVVAFAEAQLNDA